MPSNAMNQETLRKKHRCGEYWRLLHNRGIAKSDLAWLRVLDYMDQTYPPKLPMETFNLSQVK
jgi:hypothetical protein